MNKEYMHKSKNKLHKYVIGQIIESNSFLYLAILAKII